MHSGRSALCRSRSLARTVRQQHQGPSFQTAIDRTLDLARRLAERVDADPALELMTPVTTTAVCLPIPGVDHRAALDTLVDEGTALLGPAQLGGRSGIRACVTNYRTTPADIDLVADRLSELARGRADTGY